MFLPIESSSHIASESTVDHWNTNFLDACKYENAALTKTKSVVLTVGSASTHSRKEGEREREGVRSCPVHG